MMRAWNTPELAVLMSGAEQDTELDPGCGDLDTKKEIDRAERTGGFLDEDEEFVNCGPVFQGDLIGSS